MKDKLKEYFEDMVVYKDLKKTNFFSALGLPSFLRDWLLKEFADDEGNYDLDALMDYVRKYLPRGVEDWKRIKDRIVNDCESVTFLAKVAVEIDTKKNTTAFALPDFGVGFGETVIGLDVWTRCRRELMKAQESWGCITISYLPPDPAMKKKGMIELTDYRDYCPYEVSLDYFKEARAQFSLQEWLDVILGAIDYNASGYKDASQKLAMISRLLPFVEKRVNLLELAPKGTGKSYLFGRVSKYSWLSNGGTMTRAKMFYDISRSRPGLVSNNDFVALDEIQAISFPDALEMRSILQGYMESGEYTVGTHRGTADAGIILLGNIAAEQMDEDRRMLDELPEVFHASALIDRIHGFIKGWDIPRMTDDLKICGWALNSEYFCTILHMLRNDASYRAIVDELVEVPLGADTRHTEAVKRLTTGFLKLLFPHVTSPEDVPFFEFRQYCLGPALRMRRIIKTQLNIMDPHEYGKQEMPKLKLKQKYAERM